MADSPRVTPAPAWRESGRRVAARRLARYVWILLLDGTIAGLGLALAYVVRFEGNIPTEYRERFPGAVVVLVAIRLVFSLLFGLHRWSFRLSGFHEAVRLLTATASGSAGFVAFFYLLQILPPPRSVVLLEFFLTSAAMAAYRFTPRLATGWYADQRRARLDGIRKTIIVGAGSGGDLLMRDLSRSRGHSYQVVGFVDDDPAKIGTFLGGRPVLGPIDRLPEYLERFDVSQVLIAIPRLPAERIQKILRLCGRLKVFFKIIPVSFTYLNDRSVASALHDLSPEDLLQRDAHAFDTEEIRALVGGRRLLVTGAAGSIGGEIARQVASYGPSRLVLVDINENDLYFLYRDLKDKFPALALYAEVADIRDAGRLGTLGRNHRPQDVFHAAAHKHVPLMEDAPEEAVKNNVFGTWNAARMADNCGAERFVLISTDKAVHPSSVMGATKRVAELVVRDMARRSGTRFTAVRFGNVLGSAGSVVPLFKKQIERGGPVTVTHPDCRRYFMTIPEAVNLVLLAGLTQPGELCVLDMGRPMRILDLARHMITIAGLVPEDEIKIEYTGLRPGEKMTEELMTEEEEESQIARDKIYVAKSPPPPPDFADRLLELRGFAEAGEREAILGALKMLVPSFRVETRATAASVTTNVFH
jgi:FlaA1/EpsC-like NDP-sugar epimerase